jgi:hypothetical protein
VIPRAVCRHDGELAFAAVSTPNGCVAFPDDRQQFLCPQHLLTLWDGTDGDFEMLMGTENAWRMMT